MLYVTKIKLVARYWLIDDSNIMRFYSNVLRVSTVSKLHCVFLRHRIEYVGARPICPVFMIKRIFCILEWSKAMVRAMDQNKPQHYNDVILIAMASQITSHTIAYSAVYLGADHRKHQSSVSLAFVRASNAENISIWWRHHGMTLWIYVC